MLWFIRIIHFSQYIKHRLIIVVIKRKFFHAYYINPLKALVLRDLIRLKNFDIVFLLETRSSSSYVDSLKMKLNYNRMLVDKVGQAGGLAILWRKDVIISLTSFSQNHIDAVVQLPVDNPQWRFTGFYRVADQAERWRSWALLRQLASSNTLPWVIGGDFNEILSSAEKMGGIPRAVRLMEDFQVALTE